MKDMQYFGIRCLFDDPLPPLCFSEETAVAKGIRRVAGLTGAEAKEAQVLPVHKVDLRLLELSHSRIVRTTAHHRCWHNR